MWSDAKAEHEPVLIYEHIFQYLEPEYIPKGRLARIGMRKEISSANFCIVFHSNYWPVLLCFRDMNDVASHII